MQLTSAPVNIFTFGDLVLDHFIPVTEKDPPYQHAEGERVFDGHPRRTVAGGAANCARLVAAIGPGRACLWGISGRSPWGSLAEILQQHEDATESEVIYLGSHNEALQMNTITRVVCSGPTGVRTRVIRVDDVPHVPVTDSQAHDAFVRLEAEVLEHGVDAIILNQCCPGKVTPTDGKSLPLNVLWPVLPGNDLKSRGRKWPPERSIPTRHNGG